MYKYSQLLRWIIRGLTTSSLYLETIVKFPSSKDFAADSICLLLESYYNTLLSSTYVGRANCNGFYSSENILCWLR